MRKTPPDVLLTNYKMLDYLLLRPKDRQLWARNSPDDAALRGGGRAAHLRRSPGHRSRSAAAAVARAAAGARGAPDLRRHVGHPWASRPTPRPSASTRGRCSRRRFRSTAVIVEDRLSVAEFLGDATIEHVLQPRDDFGDVLDPARYLRQEEAVAAWFDVFFPDAPAPADVTDTRMARRAGRAAQAPPAVREPAEAR